MPKNSKGREIVEIIANRCAGCQLCVGECKLGAIDIVDGIAKLDPEKCVGCGKCVKVCPSQAIILDKPVKEVKAETTAKAETETKRSSEYQGVAVFIEVRDGAASDVSWELVGKAKELAAKLNTAVYGFLIGNNVKGIAQEAIAWGCNSVYTMDSPVFDVYVSSVYGNALTQICQEIKPDILLIGATPLGRDLSSIVATKLNTGLTADCTGLDIDTQENLLLMTRPTFGGNIMATILCKNHRPQMSTVRPKVMRMPVKDTTRTGEVHELRYTGFVEVIPKIIREILADSAGMVDISHSQVLIVLGKGACDSKSFPMFEELADLLGGTLACSRPIVEAGLLPYVRQVGQTGKTVAPKLYIGIGVSGAVQHVVGMQGSEKVIAINSDKNATLVQIADYSIIGDYLTVVPELIKELKLQIPNFKTAGAR